MSWLLIVGLKNALLVAPLALLALGLSRWTKRPALAHLVWVLVLVKLVTPPLVNVPVGWRLDVERWLAMMPPEPAAPPMLVRTHDEQQEISAARLPNSIPVANNEQTLIVQANVGCTPPQRAIDASPTASSEPPSASTSLATCGLCLTSVWPPSPAGWLALAAAVWLGGSAWLLGLMLYRAWRFQRFLQLGGSHDEHLVRRVRQLARAAGLSAQPRVVVVGSAVSPMLWGLGARATLVFPTALRDRLSDEEVDSLLLHELAHFARGDHWVRLLELVTHVLYWWHPVVWLARRQIETAEEACCDAWVVEHQSGSRRSYAEALLATIDFLSERVPALPPAACGLGDVPFLKQRLTQIVRGETATKLSRTATVLVVCAGLLLSPLEPALWATSSPRNRPRVTPPRATVVAELPPSLATNSPADSPAAAQATAPSPTETIPEPAPPPAPVDLILAPPPAQWAAATSPDGRYKLVARTGRKITLLHAGTAWKLDLSAHGIACVSFSPDSNSFVTGHDDGLLRWWDSGTGGLLADPLQVGSGKITSIAVARDGNRVACGSDVGRVAVWEMETRQEISRLDAAAPIGCVRWSMTGDELAISVGNFATAEQAALLIWNPLATKPRHELVLNAPAGAIAWLHGDASLLVADWGGQSGVWTFDAETLTTGGPLPKDTVSAAAWSPDCPLVSPGFIAEFPLGAAE